MIVNLKKLLAQAEKAYKSGDNSQSMRIYQSILTEFPKNSMARKGIAKIEKKSQSPKNNFKLSQHQLNSVINLYRSGKFQEAINAI